MKQLIITLGLWLLVTGLWAQNDTGAKVVTVSQTIQGTASGTNYIIQVGVPYLGQDFNSERITNPLDIRFPWDILYLFPTFPEYVNGTFDVSKGYFGDKILISWNIKSNIDLITTLKLYRREYSNNPAPWSENDFLKNISKAETEYEDKYVEGGVLYEYKLFADGVSKTEELYANYITGIGFRNPTAVVTGNVSYDGGSPVKDVIIRAVSDGGASNIGSALNIPSTGQLEIKGINKAIIKEATLQAWLKPETAYTNDAGASIRLFTLESILEPKTIDVKVKLLASSNILEVNIGGSIYKLHNYYPSGEVNYSGDETLLKVSDFNSNFVHFSVIMKDGEVPSLFINGRVISDEFIKITHDNLVDVDANYTAPYFEVEIPTITNSLALTGSNYKWDNIYIGGENAAILDEIRVWKSPLDSIKIRTDYKRYISGNNVNLISYLSANEGVGEFAYDFSRNGFNYNKNNGKLVATNWITGEENVPSSDQLGVLGITNEKGNYEITSIPYSGTGETYTITPMYGQHKFEPGNQLVFLGQGSEVVNKVDFKDKSSFIFRGKILYDSREVFTSFPKDPKLVSNAIIDEGYNVFDLNGVPYDKGEYWVDTDEAGDTYLARYSPIGVEGVQVFIDGEIARDRDGNPIVSKLDPDSQTIGFEINVPIGRHYITVKKDGHVFKYNGRFPQSSIIEKENLREFVQNSESEVVFIDETKVEVVGKVVGGAIQAQKVIGFGDQGAFSKEIVDENGESKTITVSSKNNIGIANITLGYALPGDTPLDNNKFSFKTDSITGEYRVKLLPLKYELLADDIYLKNSNDIKLYADDSFVPPTDFSEVTKLITPKYNLIDNDTIYGKPYNHRLIFEYRAVPTINVIKQTSDKEVTVRKPNGDEESVSTKGFSVPVYTQFESYQILMEAFEKYTNKDDPNNEIEDLVPVIDGEFVIDNDLELLGDRAIANFDASGSKTIYIWRAGAPFTSGDFKKTIKIKYDRKGNLFYPNPNTYKQEGIILGGESDNSAGVLTAAPDMPDFILRDPPGSNSFASIEAGSSISITEQLVSNNGIKFSSSEKIKTGMIAQVGGGLAGPIFTNSNYNDFETGSSYELSSSNANTITKKYTFNQTISTSSDPEFVGSDGDLYIGKSKNYYYGTYNKIEALSDVRVGSQALTNDDGITIYVSKTLGQTFTEDPDQTTFMYSQKYILETLIPKLQSYIDQYASGDLQPGNTEFLTSEQYEEQIIQWKSFIQENERSKYQALYQRDEYIAKIKENLLGQIAEYETLPSSALPVLDAIGSAGEYVEEVPSWIWKLVSVALNKGKKGTGGAVNAVRDVLLVLHQRKEALQKTLDFIDKNAVKNYSLDAGVGEYINSSEINLVSSQRRDIKLKTDDEFLKKTGAESNGLGFIKNISLRSSGETALGVGEENSKTSVVTYTLKDNDKNNFISVDVVNSFDGNGPIFSTKGGRTSCPYEGEDKTLFYKNNEFQSNYQSEKEKQLAIPRALFAFQYNDLSLLLNDSKYNSFIEDMAVSFALGNIYSGNDKIGVATERIEKPLISVLERKKENVPESRAAEFDLTLSNNSVIEADSDFLLIVALDGLNGAKINIEQNGTVVRIPAGKTVKYKMTLEKVAADVFDYDNINISLRSLCEGENNSAEVNVEAHFIPVCSEVVVNAPLSNWRYNLSKGFNADGTTKPLSISLGGFSTAFRSFEKIVLDYSYAGSWKPLHIYYVNEADFDAAVLNGVTNASFIGNKSALTYSWDIAGQNLPDGDYEIRARAFCSDGTDFTSEIINGSVDLNAPQRFGTPLPIDGVLGAGEDLKVSFNENIFFNSLASQIQILGQTNQEPINHSVSLYFEGLNNTTIINNPKITSGDFTLEFWMNNSTQNASASIISQEEGLQVGLANGEIYFTLGDVTAQGGITNDGFHHYTFTHKNSTGDISIYQDGVEIAGITANGNLPFTNNNALVIGGNTFIGNIHDLRLWNKTISLENAFAKMYDKLIGNEANLIGYWPMNEGRGALAKDIARYKHAIVNAAWDIKPKGTSWEFKDGNFLELDASVNLTNEMDATLSFWMKTGVSQEATIFSNGRGDGSDEVKSNGKMNKWAINIGSNGKLSLNSEGSTFVLTPQNMADDKWHHVAILFNRIGSLKTYVDAEQVSSNQMTEIGAFKDSNKIWFGARGWQDTGGFTIDRTFTGKIDEFRLWNTLRNVEQISRDRFNEMDFESIGLALYARMNAPETYTGNGPRYYYANSDPTKRKETSVANSNGVVNYSDDVPAIKPARKLTDFKVNFVINNDEMILEPDVSDWSVIEGQVLDITVGLMFDSFGNMQQSPITWTSYVKRNEMSWFAEGYNEIVDIVKNSGEEKSFEITVLNKGGKGQSYSISNIPSWLKLSKTSGTIGPDSKTIITATIDKELTAGAYLENLYLQTDFGYDEKLQIDLRVLAPEPNWTVDPTKFNYSMNIVGKIKVDGKLSEDSYDKIAAFYNGEVRGSVNLVYNDAYQEYYAFLTLYSNSVYGEELEFRIWDASKGKILEASINSNTSVTFKENDILGTLSVPVIFENTDVVEQELSMNKGWTWVSMNVNDVNFSDINKLTEGLNLETSDRILSHSPAQLETYYKNESTPSNSGWSGSISANGGMSTSKMYKVNMAHQQPLKIKGVATDVATWSFPIKENWNWLSYPLSGNQSTNEALAYFDAVDGDVIKSQNLFAIYDPIIGWNGTLNYLETGKGYMVKSSKAQSFRYPSYLAKSENNTINSISNGAVSNSQDEIGSEFKKYAENMNAVVLMPEGYTELFVYDLKGTLKGIAGTKFVNNSKLSFMTIYGELPETLVFYIGDGFNKKGTNKSFDFKSNAVLGTIAKPIILEDFTGGINMYPNPFENTITIKVNAAVSQKVTIQLYTLTSQLLFTKKLDVVGGVNSIRISPKVAAGTYLLQIDMDGKKVVSKVIKN